ncbi:hypothetical protein [Vibrio phage vB_VpaS_CHI]|nr:hypothetical protein [Vibrio phage vB_VpaS_ALK]USL90082.1 hypothetical protein [Vibrio phage vB_VpaS_CHI]
MTDKVPLLMGRRVYVCDTTGKNFTKMDEVLFHITENPMEDEITLTSESYGFFCGLNMVLLPGTKYVQPTKCERTPGSSNSAGFASGLTTGFLLGEWFDAG